MNVRYLSPLALAALLLAACGRPAGDGEAPIRTTVLVDQDFEIDAVNAPGLLEAVRQQGSELVVVNFWASWCAPCREEFPDFLRYDAEHPDVAVRFVSVDFEDDVDLAADFLRQQGVRGTTFLRTGRDQPFLNAIASRWTGSVPATAVYDAAGNRLAFWEGKVDYDQLAERVAAARNQAPQPS